VIELEHAVGQAPDNLAAARALETARTALGDVPWPSTPAAAVAPADLPLHAPHDEPLHAAEEDAATIAPPAIVSALLAGPDGPQEFGLAADWSLPDSSPPPLPIVPAPVDDDMHAEAFFAGGASPTMDVPTAHLQGDAPAGTWQVPGMVEETVAEASAGGGDGVSWFIDPPPPIPAASSDMPDEAASTWALDEDELANPWDAPALEAAVAGAVDIDESSMTACDDAVPALAEAQDASADDESSPFWTGPFAGQAAADTAASFAGWGEDAPAIASGADRSPWTDESVDNTVASWTTPAGPSSTWALGDLDEAAGADPTPFQGSLDDEDTRRAPFAGLAAATRPATPLEQVVSTVMPTEKPVAWTGEVPDAVPSDVPDLTLAEMLDASLTETLEAMPVETLYRPETLDLTSIGTLDRTPAETLGPLPTDTGEGTLADVAWTGSVKSALGEVFALAGHGESLEPPTDPSPLVREAMADTAVVAAIEDAGLRDESMPPVLASLEQMLAAVRARRAALSGSLDR
jgi:hypothetical protein